MHALAINAGFHIKRTLPELIVVMNFTLDMYSARCCHFKFMMILPFCCYMQFSSQAQALNDDARFCFCFGDVCGAQIKGMIWDNK